MINISSSSITISYKNNRICGEPKGQKQIQETIDCFVRIIVLCGAETWTVCKSDEWECGQEEKRVKDPKNTSWVCAEDNCKDKEEREKEIV